MEKTGVKIVAKNSKAFHEYFVEERFEAGIELFGTEVKSTGWHPEPQGRMVQREGRRALGAADAYQPL